MAEEKKIQKKTEKETQKKFIEHEKKETNRKEINETEEKQETKKENEEKIKEKSTGKKEIKEKYSEKTKKPFPAVIAVLAVIFIIVAGFALNRLLSEDTKKGNWEETVKPSVEIKNFYSSECSFCEKENSIIANFMSSQRNIPVKMESIDLAEEENRHYIQEFSLKSIPSALVNAKNLEEYPFEENLIKNSFLLVNEYYVVPESYLDSKPHNLMLLEGECSEQGKIFIEEFIDYQCLGCAMLVEPAKQARTNFAGEIIFEHKNFIVHENSVNAAVAAECAEQQNRFFEFNRHLFEKSFPFVFGIEREGTDNSSVSVISAGAILTGIPDLTAFNQCISEKEPMEEINADNSSAKAYGINYAPSLVFDCKYVIQGQEQTSKIEELICKIHPELKGCIKNEAG